MRQREPTIDDVAAAAGVSNLTVSRVANGAAHVKEETRLHVAAAMRDLGYEPNPMAKGNAEQYHQYNRVHSPRPCQSAQRRRRPNS